MARILPDRRSESERRLAIAHHGEGGPARAEALNYSDKVPGSPAPSKALVVSMMTSQLNMRSIDNGPYRSARSSWQAR